MYVHHMSSQCVVGRSMRVYGVSLYNAAGHNAQRRLAIAHAEVIDLDSYTDDSKDALIAAIKAQTNPAVDQAACEALLASDEGEDEGDAEEDEGEALGSKKKKVCRWISNGRQILWLHLLCNLLRFTRRTLSFIWRIRLGI